MGEKRSKRPLRVGVPGTMILLLLVGHVVARGQALPSQDAPQSSTGPQSPPGDLTQVSIEDLMNLEVTSVSKKEQKLSQVAAAIFVITPGDIRQSGATNIPDLLRMVPGMDVAQINSNTWAISARGFNFQFASKLLVLIDGRAVYSPLFGGVNWDTQDVPLEDIERIEVIRGPGGAVDEKGLELLCEVAPEVPEVVRGDSSRLRQIVINLVGNAIKFTNHGEAALKVKSDARDGEDLLLHFAVADTGIGIAEEKRDSIFEPFTQADASTTRKYGGTGLGLTISTRLVSMMGGRIWVTSEVGRGSEFHFTIRLRVADPRAIEIGTIAPPEILRGVRVLTVDDNRTNQRILEGMLKRWEMKVTSVEGGEEALAQLCAAREAGQPYGLVLTDMHMPGMDGFALVERIRERPELSTATIMMLTSAGHRGDAARCHELGVSAYLLKPIRQSELREAVARVLGARAQRGAIPLITRFSLHDAREPAASLRVLLVEDNAVNQRLASRLLEKRGHSVVVAGNGLEALEALEKESFDLVLMDVQMPVMDGFEATAAIRKKEGSSGIRVPIVALTAHAMKGDREKCLAGGMDRYLTKPIRPQELDELLENYLVRRVETTEAQESTLSKK